jgi:hypothetical protein
MKRNVLISFMLLVMMLLPAISQSSGSYVARHPKPPKVDQEKYNLGKSIFNGQLMLEEHEAEPNQGVLLADLKDQLPERLQEDFNTQSFAGKLDKEQLDALDYYVARRFKTGGTVNRYNTGYMVIRGMIQPDMENAQPADEQSATLQSLQSDLPEGQIQSANLPSLAGKLSAEQLDAVSYYVSVQKRLASSNR